MEHTASQVAQVLDLVDERPPSPLDAVADLIGSTQERGNHSYIPPGSRFCHSCLLYSSVNFQDRLFMDKFGHTRHCSSEKTNTLWSIECDRTTDPSHYRLHHLIRPQGDCMTIPRIAAAWFETGPALRRMNLWAPRT